MKLREKIERLLADRDYDRRYSGQMDEPTRDEHVESWMRNTGYKTTDGILALVRETAAPALKPFAACTDQIGAAEDDEEWAKFRLLIGDYRRARAAYDEIAGP